MNWLFLSILLALKWGQRGTLIVSVHHRLSEIYVISIVDIAFI